MKFFFFYFPIPIHSQNHISKISMFENFYCIKAVSFLKKSIFSLSYLKRVGLSKVFLFAELFLNYKKLNINKTYPCWVGVIHFFSNNLSLLETLSLPSLWQSNWLSFLWMINCNLSQKISELPGENLTNLSADFVWKATNESGPFAVPTWLSEPPLS